MSALKVRTSTGPDVWTVVAPNTRQLKVRTATGPDVWTVATSEPGKLKVRTATGPDVWTPVVATAPVAVQSVRFDAATEHYSLAAATGLGGAFTVAAWVNVAVDRNVYSTFWSIDNGSTYNSMITDSNGTELYWATNGAGLHSSHNVTVDTWYYIATAYGGGVLDTLYWSVGTAAFSSNAGDMNGANATYPFRLGASGFSGEWLNGNLAQVRIWTAQLSQVELEAERASRTVVRTSNLWAFYSFAAGPQTTDESGNGRTLTAAGSPTAGTGPPI